MGTAERARGDRWLFAGPPSSSTADAIYKQLSHYPNYILAFIWVILFRLPRALLQWSVFIVFGGHPCTEDVAWQLATGTPLILIAAMTDTTLTITIPETVSLVWFSGESPAGFTVTFDTISRRVLHATKQNQVITNPETIIAHLYAACYGYVHPRGHVMAEHSAREIYRKRYESLEPSSRFVLQLHEGLVYNKLSPMGSWMNPTHMMTSSSSLLATLETPMNHILDDRKYIVSPYYSFVMCALDSLKRLLKRYDYQLNVHNLMHNVIVHSVDHMQLYRIMSPLYLFSMDGSGSFRSYIASQFFVAMWIPFMGTDHDELIQWQEAPFYHELYKGTFIPHSSLTLRIKCNKSIICIMHCHVV
jgi:hypothetical protein